MLAFFKALPLLYAVGDVLLGWQLLWQAVEAEKKLAEIVGDGDKKAIVNENDEAAYLDGKLKSARYFIGVELAGLAGKLAALESKEAAALEIEEVSFT